LMHLRTGAGEREIDAVVETGRALIGVAVKLGRRPTAEDARALDWLRERLGERFTRGFIIHAGGDCYPLGDRIDAVPFGLLVT